MRASNNMIRSPCNDRMRHCNWPSVQSVAPWEVSRWKSSLCLSLSECYRLGPIFAFMCNGEPACRSNLVRVTLIRSLKQTVCCIKPKTLLWIHSSFMICSLSCNRNSEFVFLRRELIFFQEWRMSAKCTNAPKNTNRNQICGGRLYPCFERHYPQDLAGSKTAEL